MLFFGCRNKAEDYIYENELNEYVEGGTITKMHVAFSRDQDKKVNTEYPYNLTSEPFSS